MVGLVSDNKSVVCNHNALKHMFSNPLCKEQSVLRRVANIGFHILTLGIPLVIYKLIVCCCPSSISMEEKVGSRRPSLQVMGGLVDKKDKNISTLSDLEQESLNRGKALLEANQESELVVSQELKETYQPVSNDITSFMKLFQVYFKQRIPLLKKSDPNTLWMDSEDSELLVCVDNTLDVAFTAFVRMFEDINLYMEEYKFTSKASAFTQKGGYMAKVFDNFVLCYHDVRNNLRYEDGKMQTDRGLEANSEKHKKFYEEGTIQNKWRLLYNELCDRLRMHISEDELNSIDSRFVSLSLKDESLESYKKPVKPKA